MLPDITDKKLIELEEKAATIRDLIIEMLLTAKSGHTAGPIGMADIFSALYFYILNHKPEDPLWDGRDRLVLSNGHICPVRYAAMALSDYFPIDELKTLRKINSRLQGHPHRIAIDGLETTSGPLGEGISQSIGIALALKMDNKNNRVYCITSDGEHEEGCTWEAIMMGAKYRLDNLTVIIDRNNIQIDGFTEDVMPLDDLKKKYESFNWHVLEVNGHSIKEFIEAVAEAQTIHEKPQCIIAHTIPGFGVDFMENEALWHGKPPNSEEAKKAIKEINTMKNKIRSEY
ncbi:transketolase [Patescibacteria group bacterium]|nr:transketolase [Patescibacteria group bacterium]